MLWRFSGEPLSHRAESESSFWRKSRLLASTSMRCSSVMSAFMENT